MRVLSAPGRLSRQLLMAAAVVATMPEFTAETLTSMTKKKTGGIGGRTWNNRFLAACT